MGKETRKILVIVFILTGTFSWPGISLGADKLLQQSDLTYLGAFRVPNDNGQFSYGGRPIVYNPAHNSLFIGNSNDELVGKEGIAEISIPAIVNSSNLTGLNTASMLQAFVNAFGGNLNSIEPGNGATFAGALLNGSKLIVSAYAYYDGASIANKSHATINANWTGSGVGYSGLVTIGVPPAPNVGFTGGYMTPVPASWQTALGGSALTGMSNIAIVTRTSFGPALFSFDPGQVGLVNPVPATALLYYDKNDDIGSHWTLGPYSGANAVIGGSDMINGVVFPDGSKSVLFIGRHGDTYCYGTGAECNDPIVEDKGTHGYPYHYQIWAYNADDLAAVKTGTKKPWEVVPYSYWKVNFPIEGWKNEVNGATYDAINHRLFISMDHGDGTAPLIQIFSVNVGDSAPDRTAPAGPTRLRVQ